MPAGIGAVCVIIKKETAKNSNKSNANNATAAAEEQQREVDTCHVSVCVCVCVETPAEVRKPRRADTDAANIFACMQNGPNNAQWER